MGHSAGRHTLRSWLIDLQRRAAPRAEQYGSRRNPDEPSAGDDVSECIASAGLDDACHERRHYSAGQQGAHHPGGGCLCLCVHGTNAHHKQQWIHHRQEQAGERQRYASVNTRMNNGDCLTQPTKNSGCEQEPQGDCVTEHIGLQKASERNSVVI